MNIQAVRVTNFRSIVDSGWVPLSPDGITVFVGQNESGKTSMLEAIHFALSAEKPTENDCRISADLPRVHLRIQCNHFELEARLKSWHHAYLKAVKEFFEREKGTVVLIVGWYRTDDGAFESTFDIDSTVLLSLLSAARQTIEASAKIEDALKVAVGLATEGVAASNSPQLMQPAAQTSPETPSETSMPDALEPAVLADEIWKLLPLSVLFNEETGRLPNHVDINSDGDPTGEGAKAAQNFLDVAEVTLDSLLKSDQRARENILNKANAKVSQLFNSFWSQTIGRTGKLELRCAIDHYDYRTPSKAGRPYLVFWICDGNTQLYPMQRSQGVRWFVSFFLQLKASERRKQHRVFLLDEPGANLHAKAQADVLKLINQLGKTTSTVVYSTHSPHMLEYPKLFRVHAVQRSNEQDESPTVVIDAHRLGTASSDTLSPVLTAMGVDLSHQQVIRRNHNVLLEEMSGYYYISSFWKLTGEKQEAHFIAATGVNKIEALANMFLGWGLDFIVAVDDDKQGREAYKSIKREMFGDDEALSSKKLLKLPDCPAIEDAFSGNDFRKYVLNEPSSTYTESNSEFIKTAGRSKPVLAFQFALAVDQEKVRWSDLEDETKEKIKSIVSAIASRLC